MDAIKDFFKNIRHSDDATKKIWLIVLSVAAMAVVIGIWLLGLNAKFSKIRNAKVEASPAIAESKASLREIFSAGLKSVTAAIKGKLPSGREINLNFERNFIADRLEPLPKNNLP